MVQQTLGVAENTDVLCLRPKFKVGDIVQSLKTGKINKIDRIKMKPVCDLKINNFFFYTFPEYWHSNPEEGVTHSDEEDLILYRKGENHYNYMGSAILKNRQ